MFIATPPSSDDTERIYAKGREAEGFVMNLMRAWAWRPDVFEGFATLRAQLTANSSLTMRDQSVIVCAMASQLGDSYCALAWARKLAKEASPEAAAAVIDATDAGGLTQRDRAIAAWVRKVVQDPNSTTAADVQALRDAGLGDREIFEVTTFAAFRIAFSSVNDALGVVPDAQLREQVPAAVREAVRFGR